MSIRLALLAATALLAVGDAHIKMSQPVPFSVDTLDTAPITKSQYPCKSNLGFKTSTTNQMAVGTKQTLKLSGTAVHGGGSCQLSITTDPTPNENSVFKVIKSMEGGCPGTDGTTKDYEFTLPDSIPNGKATFAWTWFAKLSGGPEMYMNCAPIEVTGGASDTSKFNALPDMLKANLDDTCKQVASTALKFPNPGSVVEMGNTNDVVDPTGSGCGKTSGTTPVQSSASQPSTPQQSSTVPKSSAPAGQSSLPASKPVAAPSAASSAPGGVFAPGASSAAGAPAQTSTTLVTVTAAPTPTAPTQSASPGTGTSAKPSGTAPSSGGVAGTACSTNGAVVCNGEKQFGLCNNGNVVWQDVAAGTACSNGVISRRSYNGRIARPRKVNTY